MGIPRERSDSFDNRITQTGQVQALNYVGTLAEPHKTVLGTIYPQTNEYGRYGTSAMSDIVTPDYKSRSARGDIINNPMTSEVIEYTSSPLGYARIAQVGKRVDGTLWGAVYSGDSAMTDEALQPLYTGFGESYWASENQSLVDFAVTQAHANASSSELSVLMVAAEANKSVASMAQISLRAFKIFKAIKKLDLKYLKKQISRDELMDRYMEMRYALRPLLIDAKGLQNALIVSEHYGSLRQTARGFASKSWSYSDEVTALGAGGETITVARSWSATTEVRAGVLCDIETSRTSVWGLDQWIETAWEIVPFSFILDWFVNVGDTIAAWTPSAGIRERASWASVETTAVAQNSLVSMEHIGGHSSFNYDCGISHLGQKKSHKATYKSRIVNPTLSTYPHINVNLDVFKLTDLAIITSKLFGLRK